jgi:hypothetical protein
MEPVFYKGRSRAEVRRYADTLLVAALQVSKPDKIRAALE